MSILKRFFGFLLGVVLLSVGGYAVVTQVQIDAGSKAAEATVVHFTPGFRGKHSAMVDYRVGDRQVSGFLHSYRCEPGERVQILYRPDSTVVYPASLWSRYLGWTILTGFGAMVVVGSLLPAEKGEER